MGRHTHVVFDLSCRGKIDSFYGKCHCGKEELFAVWWTQPPKGWSKSQWPTVRMVASFWLDSLNEERGLWSGK